ncbi:MAG: DDE-type integrase/transposase/recombinase [Candidatus Thiodiazotropha endolucinida]|nr:DDE-type integrase/transposase/recombinase [Candidatus Thiodiazotropha endolucinida]
MNGDSSSLGHRWEKYLNKLENLFVGMNIDSRKRRKALLLHYSGDEVFDIYQTLDNTGDENGYEETKTALTDYFKPQVNEEFEIFQFRQMKQTDFETVDDFATRLRQKAEYCGFTDKTKEIKSQIIQGCKSAKLRRKVLQENLDLTNLLLAARTMELASAQAREIENGHNGALGSEQTNKVKTQKNKQMTVKHKQYQNQSRASQNKKVKCRNCGGDFPHRQGPCPAKGKFCAYCNKRDHFVSVCFKKKKQEKRQNRVKQVDLDPVTCTDSENDTDESENAETDISFGITVNQVKRKPPKTEILINGLKCKLLVDTGSSINLLNESVLNKMKTRPKIYKTDTKAYAYGQKEKLPIIGKVNTTVETHRKITTADFYIIRGNNDSLLSYDTSVQLELIPEINSVQVPSSQSEQLNGHTEKLVKQYSGLFEGIGKLKNRQIKLHIDDSVPPVAQHHRRIPFHLREKVEKELERLEKLDIIEKVDGPTDWVSPIVVAPKKNGEIRICVDMRKANEAIKRERHITPTIDDITSKLNHAKVFTKIDMNDGFNQLEISPETRNITVFSTHAGLRRYKRLNYGISASPEIFNNEIRQVLQGLDGCINISDDIIVFGKNQAEHDKNLQAVFERFKEVNLTLNKNKCLFSKSQVKFFGYIFSENGISADPEMVESIRKVKQPTTPSEVKSFLGMTGYVSRFIPQYSTLTEPLRRLTRQNQTWIWSDEQEQAFQKLKDSLTSDTSIAYFDPSKETELWVDASPVGLGAILCQENKIVAYASRALSPVEQRYSQTERECLAIVYGVEHFHLFLFGKSFTLVTDHRPLTAIFGTQSKPKAKQQSLRLERWRLRLATYDFKVVYKKGELMISDYVSRHPIKDYSNYNSTEDYVRLIATNSTPKALNLSDVASATKNDKTLQNVILSVKTNRWNKKLCQINRAYGVFSKLSHEFTVVDIDGSEVVLRGTRLVIPLSLQRHVVDLAHAGHLGIVKTKTLLREKVWFPFIDSVVEEKCKNCIPCLSVSPHNTPEPIKPSVLPNRPWEEVSIDFLGSIGTSNYFMVVIDDYSRYPLVEAMTSISAKTVIPRLDRIFSMFGIPAVCRTDNGPPFNGNEFRQFAIQMGFKHRRVTPLHPRANSHVEKFMSPLQKAIKSAVIEGHDYKQEITKFLRNYRACPHPSTGLAPADIMFNRSMKTLLPQFSVKRNDRSIRKRDTDAKQKRKQYADKKTGARRSKIRIGDSVLVKQPKLNKLTPPFNPQPGVIIEKKGSMVKVRHNDRTVTRDASHFKPIPSRTYSQNQHGTGERKTSDSTSDTGHHRSNPQRQRKKPVKFNDYVC